jgi:formate hydrogenlyase subunit 6/NADH:ubiquinone oxidoreductase subunit I
MSVFSEMIRNLCSRPFTILYPSEKVPIPKGFRGRVVIADETCIGCSKCAVVCPAKAITMVPGEREVQVGDKTVVRKKRPRVKIFRCIRCGLCERHCPTKSVSLACELAACGPDCEAESA